MAVEPLLIIGAQRQRELEHSLQTGEPSSVQLPRP
jgi:hypothetical protein